MADLVRHPRIDEILDAHVERAGGDEAAWAGYRSHAHRVFNFARAVSDLGAEDEEKLAIAAAFHDLYAFDGLDYIEPSIEAAGTFLRDIGQEGWDQEVALTIAFHHRVRPYRGAHARLVEPFRRADWNDFTLGAVRWGIPRDVRRQADREFPVKEFIPKAVARFGLFWVPRHPLRPAPVFRGRAALHRTGRSG